MNTLIKNTREILEGFTGKDSPEEEEKESKKNVESVFTVSRLCKVVEEAKEYLQKNPLNYAVKLYVLKDMGMIKLELNLICFDITSSALENLGLKFENSININFLYNPDVKNKYLYIL